jgi:FixJ family two-component response regulator/GGDEF domain-containing protein
MPVHHRAKARRRLSSAHRQKEGFHESTLIAEADRADVPGERLLARSVAHDCYRRHGFALRLACAIACGGKHCTQEGIVTEKVLFVDDEPLVLDALRRMLHDKFLIRTADSGEKGLAVAKENGPFALVISDMRMPGMNGAEFLARMRTEAPETVRMLLTGFTDLDAAIAAVNEGNIFRFLTKPCKKEELTSAINLGLAQYRAIVAEKELVKKAQTVEQPAADWDAAEICEWDNCKGPTGLPGPSQARELLTALFGADHQTYVILFRLTVLATIEERYGEEAGADYLINAAHFLTQSLRSDDRLFHWGRYVLMAVIRRAVSPAAVRMEMARLTLTPGDQVLDVHGRSIMVATSIDFDFKPVSQFPGLGEMLAAFDPQLSGKNEGAAVRGR